jgi:glycosyltransferase involved in cell wall biosynthesis
MSRPTLSVVMSNYNHARFLPAALQSVLDQSYQPKEIILIDDGSTDHSVVVIERFVALHPSIRFHRNERNMGILHNLGMLVGMATGDFLFGIACDDMLLPGFLEKSMSLLEQHPGAGVCSCLSRMMDEDGNDRGVLPGMIVSEAPTFIPPARAKRILRSFGNWMQGNTTVYRREGLIRAGGFRPELHSFCDNFASQVLALKHGACFIPEPLCTWRYMRGTYSASCLADLEVGRQIVRNATALMRGEFKDLFPRGYFRNWEREYVFERAKISQFVRRDGAGEGPGSAGRTTAWSARLRAGLVTLYLMARHRPVLSVRRRIKIALSSSSRRLAQLQH